jgi:hypothetical protein
MIKRDNGTAEKEKEKRLMGRGVWVGWGERERDIVSNNSLFVEKN